MLRVNFPEVVKMKKLAIRAILSFVFATAGMFAQDTTGAITGTVSDPSGASVAGAEVKILNSQTGFSRSARTGDAGEYRIPFVLPGIYDVTAQHQGFKTQTQQALRVEIQQTRTVNFGLELALHQIPEQLWRRTGPAVEC
jgi:hypothetical protein